MCVHLGFAFLWASLMTAAFLCCRRSQLGVAMWNDVRSLPQCCLHGRRLARPPTPCSFQEVPATFASAVEEAEALLGINATSGTSGHTKGVLAGNSGGGFWLTHSMPLFPVLTGAHFTWTPSTTYGQMFLCVSLKTAADVDAAAQQVNGRRPLKVPRHSPSSCF